MDEHRTGPRRSEQARLAVLGAAAELLARTGYENLTIEAIARQAGVGKQTIYRWWPSRGAILAEALLEGLIFRQELAVGDTGDLRRDLTDWVERVHAVLATDQGRALFRALLAAAAENPELGELLRVQLGADGGVRARLAASGEAGPAAGVADEVADAIAGVIILRALSGQAPAAGSAAALIASLLPG
ncbi:TetR/AcrR family transcriptional regulator [Microbacterium radiodurans]|uniref:TetR/AcrR family transcriptional regulator n=1 Tax=Microbacterium radiodurans TaxID=661398 RepID=A0A5J5IUE2_9MICO|nr:TetR/AcrR family transcriptional regulator [Microbacterium radiodurans]KAA9089734.1 TetR/AcrR family transcriptional regulator [Microbacterium radiodurans]